VGNYIDMIEGSSIAQDVVLAQVREKGVEYDRVLMCLDSNHSHEHVPLVLEAYAPYVHISVPATQKDHAIFT
jgi:cephalosporin hydroxylase